MDIWTPATSVYSSVASSDSSYSYFSGTSIASPHTTGFVANLLLIVLIYIILMP